MQRLLRRRWRLAVATVFAGSLVSILLVLAARGGAPFWPSRTDQPPAAAAPAQTGMTSEMSVLTQPRDLPEIRFVDAGDRNLSLADFRGKVVLLNLWATWCVPCRKEMPSLDRLQGQLGGDDFTVLALSIDRAGLPTVKRFYEEFGLQHIGLYLDVSGAASRAFGAPGLPTTLLIDRAGREVARKVGPAEWDSPEMLALVGQRIAAQAERNTRP